MLVVGRAFLFQPVSHWIPGWHFHMGQFGWNNNGSLPVHQVQSQESVTWSNLKWGLLTIVASWANRSANRCSFKKKSPAPTFLADKSRCSASWFVFMTPPLKHSESSSRRRKVHLVKTQRTTNYRATDRTIGHYAHLSTVFHWGSRSVRPSEASQVVQF